MYAKGINPFVAVSSWRRRDKKQFGATHSSRRYTSIVLFRGLAWPRDRF